MALKFRPLQFGQIALGGTQNDGFGLYWLETPTEWRGQPTLEFWRDIYPVAWSPAMVAFGANLATPDALQAYAACFSYPLPRWGTKGYPIAVPKAALMIGQDFGSNSFIDLHAALDPIRSSLEDQRVVTAFTSAAAGEVSDQTDNFLQVGMPWTGWVTEDDGFGGQISESVTRRFTGDVAAYKGGEALFLIEVTSPYTAGVAGDSGTDYFLRPNMLAANLARAAAMGERFDRVAWRVLCNDTMSPQERANAELAASRARERGLDVTCHTWTLDTTLEKGLANVSLPLIQDFYLS